MLILCLTRVLVLFYNHRGRAMCVHSMHGGVAKLVIAPACQAGDRGFNPRRSRYRYSGQLCHGTQRVVAQGLARSVRDREVGGSNPPNPRYFRSKWLLHGFKRVCGRQIQV